MYRQGADDESRVWELFLAGSDEAFSLLYDRYAAPLFSYGLTLTTDREMIRDCVQDVFINMHKRREQLKNGENIRLYLFVSLRNRLLNTLKKHARNISFEKSVRAGVDPASFSATTNEETGPSGEVVNLLSRLNPRQREIMHYRFVENMSIGEISVITGINYQSVSNSIQRSLKKLTEHAHILRE